ncbi:MAG: IS200/IS605 family transposase [Candidatus Cloacimonetes bacterium]|nr:IS200/IS605 family transposase [Candidatus Cloacimonadota bacterium]
MPTSYCHLATHIIFSTKDRYKFLTDQKKTYMHQYITGIITNINGFPIEINGIDDHIHILCLLPKEESISRFVQVIKSNSSKWFRQKHHPKFSWQIGYAAFGVSKSNIDKVAEYIKQQEEHHRKNSFQEEYKSFIEKHGFVFQEE